MCVCLLFAMFHSQSKLFPQDRGTPVIGGCRTGSRKLRRTKLPLQTSQTILSASSSSPTQPTVFLRDLHLHLLSFRMRWHVDRNSTEFYLIVYSGIVGANLVFALLRAFLFAYGGICAARRIHRRLFKSILQVLFCLYSDRCGLENTCFAGDDDVFRHHADRSRVEPLLVGCVRHRRFTSVRSQHLPRSALPSHWFTRSHVLRSALVPPPSPPACRRLLQNTGAINNLLLKVDMFGTNLTPFHRLFSATTE